MVLCEIGIIGAGGFAREVMAHMLSDGHRASAIDFFVDEKYVADYPNAKPISALDVGFTKVIVAVGRPADRQRIVESLPAATQYATFVHRSAQILSDDVNVGQGAVILANAVLTTNIAIGDHCHLNYSTTVGHDCRIGNFFTASPGVNVSGNCSIGDRVYLGANAAIREKIKICSDTTIGLNSGVVRDIVEPGTYAGLPSRPIR